MSLLFNRQFQEESEKNALQVKSERTVSHLLTVNESQPVKIFAVQARFREKERIQRGCSQLPCNN